MTNRQKKVAREGLILFIIWNNNETQIWFPEKAQQRIYILLQLEFSLGFGFYFRFSFAIYPLVNIDVLKAHLGQWLFPLFSHPSHRQHCFQFFINL